MNDQIAVLGAGLAGCAAALELARLGMRVDLYDRQIRPVAGASLHNEGKLHLGYVYGADPERRSHQRLAEGALRFLSDISALTGAPVGAAPISRRFAYGVPYDSQRSAQEVLRHFEAVDDTVEALIAVGAGCVPGFSRSRACAPADLGMSPDRVAAAFATSELAVETGWIADCVGAAVMAEPRIRFFAGCRIEAVAVDGHGVTLEWSGREGPGTARYDGVINAMWEEAAKFDAAAGLDTAEDQLLRFKAAITLEGLNLETVRALPSVTLVTGAYGDLVNHGDGRAYVSWYPVCKLGQTSGLEPGEIADSLNTIDDKALAQRSIEALAGYVPAARALLSPKLRVRVGGGVIVARGASDIDDPASGLHSRSDIGVRSAGAFVSIATGKYCTAPWFGREAGRQMVDILAS